MIEDKKEVKLPHNLILEGRKLLNIGGVLDVDSFDDRTVVAYTSIGELTIKGVNLHINKLSLDTGELIIDGEISSMVYIDNMPSNSGIFSKLFR